METNILEYIKWRGDLSPSVSEYNEIDILIFSRLAYLDFSKSLKNNKEEVSLREAYDRYLKIKREERLLLWPQDEELFPLVAMANRYKDIKLTYYVNSIEKDIEKQFSVITLILPNKRLFISYRGTDNTLVGWKEDFNLSFMSDIPAQMESVKYLNEVSKRYPDYIIETGGHSKGGNLAIYAASFCEKEVQEKIIGVYNYDGPGFDKEMTERKGYKEVLSRIATFIPQSSIVGRLLIHEEKYKVVESIQKGILQHDIYSWQIAKPNHFIYLDEIKEDSEFVDKTLKEWLNDLSREDREKFVDTIFDILMKTNANTLEEFSGNWMKNVKTIFETYKDLDAESKEHINKALNTLWKSTKNNLVNGRKKHQA